MKNLLTAVALASVAALASAQTETRPAAAPEQGRLITVPEVETVGEVLRVDKSRKNVTIKDSQGRRVKVDVPADVLGLEQVKPGATLDLKYLPPVAVAIAKPGAPQPRLEAEARLAPRAGVPSELAVKTRKLSAMVEDFDQPDRQMTVKGPDGYGLTLQVPETFAAWEDVKVGEMLVFHYTEAVALTASLKESRPRTEKPSPDRTDTDTKRPGSYPGY